ncbi:MAG: hypothetical protein ACP5M4_13110 [Acidobacteriaceae bacterium]
MRRVSVFALVFLVVLGGCRAASEAKVCASIVGAKQRGGGGCAGWEREQ